MKRSNLKLFVLLLCTTGVFAQTKLQYNYQSGKGYKYKMTNDGTVTQTVMGQEMKITIDGNFYYKLETEKNNPSDISLFVSLDSAKLHINMPMKDTTATFDNMIGKRTELVVSKSGKILNKKLVDTLEGDPEMINQINSATTKFVILPDNAVKKGETWNIEDVDSTIMMGGTIKTKTKVDYTFTGKIDTLGHSCIVVEFKGKTSSEGKTKAMGMDLFIEGNGKISGSYYFDVAKGLIVFAYTQTDNEMSMATTGEQSMIIPISQSTKATQALLE